MNELHVTAAVAARAHRHHVLRPRGGHAEAGELDGGEEGEQVRRAEVHRAPAPHLRHQVRHSPVVPRHRLEPAHALVLQGLLPALLLQGVHAGQPRGVSEV